MEDTHADGDCGPDRRIRCVFSYSVDGDVRFISHHDTLRMFRRALARGRLPVRFSEGFNPHPRIMIPLPRPVGVASDVEALVVDFERPMDEGDALARLGDQMPSGVRLTGARMLEDGERLAPDLVRYRISPDAPAPPDLMINIRRVLDSEALAVERKYPKKDKSRSMDLRPFLADVRLEGENLEFAIRVTDYGTARPAEIAGLLGYDADSINHRIRRIEVKWR